MLELDFLGVQPDGTHLMLNDGEGNRYLLAVTDELRAALRRDRSVEPGEEPKPMSPKEIQAHFRSGMTLEEVSDLTSLPVSQLTPFEYPIRAERSYIAERARGYRLGHEIGALSVEELVASRLKSRDVSPESIAWDAVRPTNSGWQLIATYPAGGKQTTAIWDIDVESSALHARNDEAVWLSETEIPAKDAPWRPLSPSRASEKPSVETSAASSNDVSSMLDQLAAKRGKHRSAPIPDEDYAGSHPDPAETDQGSDAAVFSLPPRTGAGTTQDTSGEVKERADVTEQDPASEADEDRSEPTHERVNDENLGDDTVSERDSNGAAEPDQDERAGSTSENDGLFPAPAPKKKRPSNRPAMPSWDEIVFGSPRKDS